MPTPFRFQKFVERHLRRILFPNRDTDLSAMADTELRVLSKDQIPSSTLGAQADLELEIRVWLRDFWSKAIIAWIALTISFVSLAISIISLFAHP